MSKSQRQTAVRLDPSTYRGKAFRTQDGCRNLFFLPVEALPLSVFETIVCVRGGGRLFHSSFPGHSLVHFHRR